jgi:ATP-binding cassette subfamily F protein 3
MQSKDILKSALLQFDGTLILVSHDRDFLKGLSNKVFEFRDKKIKEHLGDISYFLEKRRLENLQELERSGQRKQDKSTKVSGNKQQYLERKEKEKQRRKLQRKIDELESEIEELESMIAIMDEQLSRPEDFNLKLEDGSFYAKYEQSKQRLEKNLEEWERLSGELEEIG